MTQMKQNMGSANGKSRKNFGKKKIIVLELILYPQIKKTVKLSEVTVYNRMMVRKIFLQACSKNLPGDCRRTVTKSKVFEFEFIVRDEMKSRWRGAIFIGWTEAVFSKQLSETQYVQFVSREMIFDLVCLLIPTISAFPH